MAGRHTTTVAIEEGLPCWRCTCGSWGRSLFYDMAWAEDRAAYHERLYHGGEQ